MTEEQEKTWMDACKKAEKEKGYVPAELLMLPMILKLAEEGLVEIGCNDEYTIITSKGEKSCLL